MREPVIIKSFCNGICILLDPEMEFCTICEILAGKLREAKKFFGTVSVALSIEGRSLSREEERRILDVIYANSDLKILCIVGNDEEKDRLYLRAIRYTRKKLFETGNGQFYKGNLTRREVLETDSGIVILGDVLKGCKVISKGNIVVLGRLYGDAYAGAAGDDRCQITALEMEPEKLRIGDFKYDTVGRQRRWGAYIPRFLPTTAYVKNKRIVMDVLTKDLP